MQVISRRGSSSGGSGAGGAGSDGSRGAGGCGHGECTEREERCDKDSCAGRHCFDEVVKDIMIVVVVGIENWNQETLCK